ncbi:hypothetical protein [Pseudactinotalea sp. Z1748]|uniref:hypothetical protein n=1 Tax=Pseudactinotalea sp. Z1748 TaxID=3413027 RepID=UPI003C7DC875
MSTPVPTPAVPSTTPPSTIETRIRRARIAAALAAAILIVNGVLTFFDGDLSDHTTGIGLVSEVTAGAAFLAGALALALIVPVTGWGALLWWLAPAGLTIAGVIMLGVPITGQEPAEWLFLLAVVPTSLGLIAAGVLGSRRRWPWWTGAGLALFLPIMFLAPFNGLLMALVWLAVAITLRAE